jgi:thioredoxin reductase/SAM-dependent methyltransferase
VRILQSCHYRKRICHTGGGSASVDAMDTDVWDAVIIGGGVAGLSAAQMLGRARRRTLVIDGGAPRNRFAAHMHGVLGHDGVDPAELLARGRAEAAAYGVEVVVGEVATVHDTAEDGLRVVLTDGREERTRALLVATGVRDDLPDIPGLAPLWGRSVLHCPYCHGWEVADRRLGVLATSPASVHQMELIRQWSSDVTAFTALAEPLPAEVTARLLARSIRIVSSPVRSLVVDNDDLSAVTDAEGVDHPVDALFVAPAPTIDVRFLSDLALVRAEQPGAPLAVDALGATSHPRVWAAGNVTVPFGNVPLSMGAGSMAGAAINAALVAEDAAAAVRRRREQRNLDWEERYTAAPLVWSGRVNATLADVVAELSPGAALDVGCGEGADALWLAEHGWTVTGVDVSVTAVRRAEEAARRRGVADRVRFVAGDAVDGLPAGVFDLVSASFLHSWEPDFPRYELLRAAAERVARGGRLLVLSHAAPPPWVDSAGHDGGHTGPRLLGPVEELEFLGLDPESWTAELVEVRPRDVTAPDGSPATLDDGVILVRRTR